MYLLISVVKTVIEVVLISFLFELVGRIFLRHTMVGRCIARLFKVIFKLSKWSLKVGKAGSKVVMTEAKLTCNSIKVEVEKHKAVKQAKLIEDAKKDSIVNGESIVKLAENVAVNKGK